MYIVATWQEKIIYTTNLKPMILTRAFFQILSLFFIGNLYSQTEIVKDSLDHPISIVFYGDKAIVALHGAQPHQGQIISFEIDNPIESYTVLFDSLSSYPRSLAIKGNDLYIAFTVYIGKVNLNASNLELEEFIPNLFFPRCLIFDNDELYIGEDDKISVVSVVSTNPIPLEVIGDLEEAPLSMAIENEKLYIATGNNIARFDLNSPQSELEYIYSEFEYKIYSIAIIDGKLYLDQGDLSFEPTEKILRFDLTNSENSLETYLGGLVSAIGITYYDNHLFFASPKPNFVGEFEGKVIKVSDEIVLSQNTIDSSPFVIYPNPTSGMIRIDGMNLMQSSIVIFDQHGRIVLKSQGREQLNLDKLPNGVYFLEINNKGDKQAYRHKLIISK